MGLFGFVKKKEIAQKVNEEVSGFTPAEEKIMQGQNEHDLNWDESLPSFKRSDSLDIPITKIPYEPNSDLDLLAMEANLGESAFPEENEEQEAVLTKPISAEKIAIPKEEVVSSKDDGSFVKGNSIFMSEENYASFYSVLEEIKKGFLEISKEKAQAKNFEMSLKSSSNEMAKSVSEIAKFSLECEDIIKKGGESA
jgi:hypothetical protein